MALNDLKQPREGAKGDGTQSHGQGLSEVTGHLPKSLGLQGPIWVGSKVIVVGKLRQSSAL